MWTYRYFFFMSLIVFFDFAPSMLSLLAPFSIRFFAFVYCKLFDVFVNFNVFYVKNVFPRSHCYFILFLFLVFLFIQFIEPNMFLVFASSIFCLSLLFNFLYVFGTIFCIFCSRTFCLFFFWLI